MQMPWSTLPPDVLQVVRGWYGRPLVLVGRHLPFLYRLPLPYNEEGFAFYAELTMPKVLMDVKQAHIQGRLLPTVVNRAVLGKRLLVMKRCTFGCITYRCETQVRLDEEPFDRVDMWHPQGFRMQTVQPFWTHLHTDGIVLTSMGSLIRL